MSDCGVVVGDEMHEEEVVGSNPGACIYSKQVNNKSCKLWSVLSPLGYIKNVFSYFY